MALVSIKQFRLGVVWQCRMEQPAFDHLQRIAGSQTDAERIDAVDLDGRPFQVASETVERCWLVP